MASRIAFTFLAGLAVVFAAGCGGEKTVPMAKVTGTVKYKGKVVSGATVTFVIDGNIATANTADDGTFTIPSVPIGKAQVTIVKHTGSTSGGKGEYDPSQITESTKIGGPPNMPNTAAKNALPVKYADKELSGLDKEVSKDESENNFTFDLT